MSPQQREAALRLAYSADSAETCEYIGTDSWIREAAALLRSLAVEPQPAGPGDMAVYQAIADGYTHPPAKQEPLTEEEIAIALTPVVPGLLIEQASAIESACAKKWGVKL